MLLKSLTRFSVGLLLAFPIVSHADTLKFTLTEPTATEPTATYIWSLASNPTPFSAKAGSYFAFVDLAISFNGSPLAAESLMEFIPFSDAGGGFSLSTSSILFETHGAQIYSGSELSPVFAPGTFNLTDLVPDPSNPVSAVLTITEEPSTGPLPIPEPTSLIFLGTSLACFVGLRRRLSSDK